jgi:hypothetical protein
VHNAPNEVFAYFPANAPEQPQARPSAPNVFELDGQPYMRGFVNTALSSASYKSVLSTYKSDVAMPTSDELTDAKIGKSEAQTETKIARLEGRLETIATGINGKLDSLIHQVGEQRRDRNLIIGSIVASALAIAVLVIGLATYGDAIFGRGMNVRDVVQAVVREQQHLQEGAQSGQSGASAGSESSQGTHK